MSEPISANSNSNPKPGRKLLGRVLLVAAGVTLLFFAATRRPNRADARDSVTNKADAGSRPALPAPREGANAGTQSPRQLP